MNESAAATSRVPPRLARWQFSLRSMLALSLVAACALWGWRSLEQPSRSHQHAVERVKKLGGRTTVQWQGPDWLPQPWAQRSFDRVVAVDLSGTSITDDDLAFLRELPELTGLDLHGTSVTNAACEHLRHLSNLRELNLHQTRITRRLEEIGEFPNLQIARLGHLGALPAEEGNGIRIGDVRYDEVLPGELRLRGGTWSGDHLEIASSGEATLRAEAGSTVRVGSLAILGKWRTTGAHVILSGPGTTWDSRWAYVGIQGEATITASQGARLDIRFMNVATDRLSKGTFELADPGTILVGSDCKLGEQGNATLRVRNEAKFEIHSLEMALHAGRSLMVLEGTGTVGECTELRLGTARIEIQDAQFRSGDAHLGRPGMPAEAILRGQAKWNIDAKATIGDEGVGTLEIGDQGQVHLRSLLVIGRGPESQGHVTVGPQAELHAQWVDVGIEGRGVLALAPESKLFADSLTIGVRGEVSGPTKLPRTENGGLLMIGPPGAVARVGSSYLQEAKGRLQIQVGSDRSSQLEVAGKAKLDGRLELVLAEGAAIEPGTRYTILKAAEVEGRFARILAPRETVLEDWKITYGPREVVLVYRP